MRSVVPAMVALLVGSSALGFEGVQFESGHVHPIELSADGERLYAVNTSEHHLSVFDASGVGTPVLLGEVFVGMEPVSVRERVANEAWVVSHISDAVNIVDTGTMKVVRTLLPGDEPTDVVFAGNRAFVCVSQEDRIAVYDTTDLDAAPVFIDLDMSDPRSLVVSSDGSRVYVCALDSQNETTIVHQDDVASLGGPPAPDPPMDAGLPAPPEVSLIVRYDGATWRDETGGSWDAAIPYTLLDHDVVGIDTASLAVVEVFRGVGTTLFNLAVNPVSGELYCTNQEALNEVRFEPNLNANFVRNRITIIDPTGGGVTPTHLNPHIDFSNPAGSALERAESLAFPLDIAVSGDGTAVYVAAFGSKKVGVLNATTGARTRTIDVGDGPSGLALDEADDRLFVMNRLASTVSIVSLLDDSAVDISIGYDPSPQEIKDGRSLFYDAAFSSAHGEATCASCHVFAGMDNISWDLGDPTGELTTRGATTFHPMKGPMATQSLKGLPPTSPFHWRGDRETLADFNPAFVSLLGRATELTTGEFASLEAFIESTIYPPNPNQNLDGSIPDPPSGPNPLAGQQLFETGSLVGGIECVDCHTMPTGALDLIIPAALLQDSQDFLVPHLRNMYEKTRFDRDQPTNVRGFGFTKDGAIDTMMRFLEFPAFNFSNDGEREDMTAFMMAFNFETAAALGAQWTLDATNGGVGIPRINTLMAVADAAQVGLIAKGPDGTGTSRGWTYLGAGDWMSDRDADPLFDLDDLTLLAAAEPITFTAVLLGSEDRLGTDRDRDGFLDRDELDAGSDPANPASTPDAVAVPDAASVIGADIRVSPNPARGAFVTVSVGFENRAPVTITVHDVQGRLVRTLARDEVTDATAFAVEWDFRNDSGRRVEPGIYFVRGAAAEASSSQRLVVMR